MATFALKTRPNARAVQRGVKHTAKPKAKPRAFFEAAVDRHAPEAIDLQTKLEVSEPGDELEREADQVADHVMRAPEPDARNAPPLTRAVGGHAGGDEGLQREVDDEEDNEEEASTESLVQRACAECGDDEKKDEPRESGVASVQRAAEPEANEELEETRTNVQRFAEGPLQRACETCAGRRSDEEEVQRATEGGTSSHGLGRRSPLRQRKQNFEDELAVARATGGQPLPAPLQAFFESRFGENFSSVRLHGDERANLLARSVRAKAFTVGSDLFFRSGAYQPNAASGKRLIAHELTHVLQQRGGLHRVKDEVPAKDGGVSARPALQRTLESHDEQEKELRGRSLERPTMASDGQPAPATAPAERQADEVGDRIAADLGPVGFVHSGQLGDAVRAVAEQHLGVDLGDVRLDDSLTGQFQAVSFGARAITHGTTVSFAEGELDTGSEEGRALLGHELTHVAQQRAHDAAGAGGQRAEEVDFGTQNPTPQLADVSTSAEVGENRKAETELAEASIEEPEVEPEPEKDERVQAADAQAKEAEEAALAPDVEAEAQTPADGAEAAEADPEAEAAEEEAALTEEAAATAVELRPVALGPETSDVAAQAANSLMAGAKSEVAQVRATAEEMRGGIHQAVQSSRDSIATIVEDSRTGITEEFANRRAAAAKQEAGAAVQAKAGLDKGKEATGEETDVTERATGLGDEATTDAKETAQDKKSEQESKTSGEAGSQGGGLLALVRSSVIVKIGAEIGKRVLEAGKQIIGDLGSLVSEAISVVGDFASDVLAKLTSAFANVLSILPSALGDFVGNLGQGESESLGQLEELDAKVKESLDKIEADATSSIDQSEIEALRNLQQIYERAAAALPTLDASLADQGEEALAAGMDDLTGGALDAMQTTRLAATELMARTRATLEAEASQAPTRFQAQVATIVGATKSGLSNAQSGFFGGLKAVVTEGLKAIGDAVTGVGETIGNFLGSVGDKLGEVVSSLVTWATNAISELARAFADGARRIVSWVTDKLSRLSPLNLFQTKRGVVQRGVLDIIGGAFLGFFQKLITLGLLLFAAGVALGIGAALGGPLGLAIVAAILALLIVAALVMFAIDVIQRMRKGGFPVWLIVLTFGSIFLFELIGIFPIMSGILGEDILSGEKIKDDTERGKKIGGGLFDFALFVVTVLTAGATSGASAAGGTGARGAGLLGRIAGAPGAIIRAGFAFGRRVPGAIAGAGRAIAGGIGRLFGRPPAPAPAPAPVPVPKPKSLFERGLTDDGAAEAFLHELSQKLSPGAQVELQKFVASFKRPSEALKKLEGQDPVKFFEGRASAPARRAEAAARTAEAATKVEAFLEQRGFFSRPDVLAEARRGNVDAIRGLIAEEISASATQIPAGGRSLRGVRLLEELAGFRTRAEALADPGVQSQLGRGAEFKVFEFEGKVYRTLTQIDELVLSSDGTIVKIIEVKATAPGGAAEQQVASKALPALQRVANGDEAVRITDSGVKTNLSSQVRSNTADAAKVEARTAAGRKGETLTLPDGTEVSRSAIDSAAESTVKRLNPSEGTP